METLLSIENWFTLVMLIMLQAVLGFDNLHYFPFVSILSTIALTEVFWVMAVGVIVTGIGMIMLADTVSEFLERNRMYQVLGLIVLLLVGVLLVSEGGHLSYLKLFGHEVLPLAKSTFYFVLFVMVAVDLVQGRYQKKLMKERQRIEAMVTDKENSTSSP